MNRYQGFKNIRKRASAWACALLVALLSCGVAVSPVQAVAQSDAATARAQILQALRREGYLRQSTAMQRAKAERRKRLIKALVLFAVVVPGSVFILYRLAKSIDAPRPNRGPAFEPAPGPRESDEDAAKREEADKQRKERREEDMYRQRWQFGGEPPEVAQGRVTLGVAANASWQDVRRAHRREALRAHPDKGGSTAEMQRVNDAFEHLSYHYRVMGLQGGAAA